MIDKETAINIAIRVIPDLELRSYKITDQNPGGKSSLNLPLGCWYLKYSPATMNYAACSTGRSLYLCIDKETGDIKS